MNNLKNLVSKQLSRKQEIDNLPDGERYPARQRWIEDSIELLLLHAIDIDERVGGLT
jgi:hypothetical protein